MKVKAVPGKAVHTPQKLMWDESFQFIYERMNWLLKQKHCVKGKS